MNCLGRFYRENPNEWNRNTTGRQVLGTTSGLMWWDQGVHVGIMKLGGAGAGPASGEPGKTCSLFFPLSTNKHSGPYINRF